jgi:hypothetical protein
MTTICPWYHSLIIPCLFESEQSRRQEPVAWSEIDKAEVDAVMGITPDTFPCDLAVLCRKPCVEVLSQSTSRNAPS